tara:strand:+ start:47 stop:235 length:189 start_codon:yes stop_codon:yes gene_type:complete
MDNSHSVDVSESLTSREIINDLGLIPDIGAEPFFDYDAIVVDNKIITRDELVELHKEFIMHE